MNAIESSPETVWALIKKIGTTTLVTRDGESLDARPLQAYVEPEAMKILFMTDSQRVLSQIARDRRVLLSLADKGSNDYVTLTGTAVISNDRSTIKRLWSVWAEAFWDSPDDPNIRLMVVTPEHARFWDAPGKVVSTVAMLAGVVSGKHPKLGTSGELQL